MIDHPCFRNLARAVHLSGFSGAIIALVDRSEASPKVVRKASADPSGSARLRDQALLQAELRQKLGTDIHVPEILDQGVCEGCYWYDMEQVKGIDAVEYLAMGSRVSTWNFRDRIEETLRRASEVLPGGISSEPVDLQLSFQAKLQEIDTRTREKFLPLTDMIRRAIEGEQTLLSQNVAHGDLTLENIFVTSDGRLSLIDTIPSPFFHYWIDIAKLFQDLEGRWFANRGRQIPIGVTKFLSDSLFALACDLRPDYERWHGPMLALTFARILPYCRTEKDTAFTTSRINSALRAN